MTNAVKLLLTLTIALLVSGCGAPKTQLFNGRDLTGWKPVLESPANPQEVWTINDGVLRCAGKPTGFIRTTETYSNFKLHLEWRWPGEPTNSGVLLRAGGQDKVWPLCIEAQLMNQNAGDFVTINPGAAITVKGERVQPAEAIYKISPKFNPTNEKPAGQWNNYDIECRGGQIRLWVNGLLQNEGSGASLASGFICLQSEGSPIEFRNITLQPLK